MSETSKQWAVRATDGSANREAYDCATIKAFHEGYRKAVEAAAEQVAQSLESGALVDATDGAGLRAALAKLEGPLVGYDGARAYQEANGMETSLGTLLSLAIEAGEGQHGCGASLQGRPSDGAIEWIAGIVTRFGQVEFPATSWSEAVKRATAALRTALTQSASPPAPAAPVAPRVWLVTPRAGGTTLQCDANDQDGWACRKIIGHAGEHSSEKQPPLPAGWTARGMESYDHESGLHAWMYRDGSWWYSDRGRSVCARVADFVDPAVALPALLAEAGVPASAVQSTEPDRDPLPDGWSGPDEDGDYIHGRDADEDWDYLRPSAAGWRLLGHRGYIGAAETPAHTACGIASKILRRCAVNDSDEETP